MTTWRAMDTAVRPKINLFGGRHGWMARGEISEVRLASDESQPIAAILVDFVVSIRLRIVHSRSKVPYRSLLLSILPNQPCSASLVPLSSARDSPLAAGPYAPLELGELPR